MPWKNSNSRYSTVSIALHWLMLVLLALVYACIELRGLFPKGSGGRTLIVESHFMLGLTVFVLVWLRLFARSLGPAPQIFPASPKWQTLLAKLMHWALYLFMIAMPILGWLVTSAKGNQVMFYGFDLPLLVAQNKDLAKQIQGWHELGGTLGYWLIGLHAVAGLYHHYVVGDNTLLRMMPKRVNSNTGS
jgi:cytochrome b561